MAVKKYARHPRDVPILDIEEALLNNHGVVKSAADKLKVSRSELSKFVLADERLAEIRKEAFQCTVDQIESDFISDLLKGKDKIRQIFFLKCHGKDRGWVERHEVTGKDGEHLGEVVAPVRQMNSEAWTKENLKVVS
jgi:hypothetical protein